MLTLVDESNVNCLTDNLCSLLFKILQRMFYSVLVNTIMCYPLSTILISTKL